MTRYQMLAEYTGPIASRTASAAKAIPGSYRFIDPTWRRRPVSSASAANCSASSTSAAKGFSTKTCLPARSASDANGR